MEAGHPVSPSEEIDQAWHLHLTYTESYWQKLCGEVLGRRLHHHPTKGGADEASKFDGQYRSTLASYQRLFGEAAPADLWAPAETREHAKGGAHRWVDTGRHWIVSKRLAWTGAAAGALGWFAFASGGCSTTQLGMVGIFDLKGPDFLIFFLVLCAIAIPLARWIRSQCCTPQGEPGELELPGNDYELACLAGGTGRVLQTVLVAFHAEKWIEIQPGAPAQVRRIGQPKRTLEGAEAAVWQALPADCGFIALTKVRKELAAATGHLESVLLQKGLFSRQAGRGTFFAMTILLGVGAIGIHKLSLGLDRGRPVGFLFVLLLIFGGYTLVQLGLWSRSRRSGRGQAALRLLRDRHELPEAGGANLHGPVLPTVGTAAALFGLTALPLYGMGTLQQSLRPPNSGSWDAGGSSSCGSSCGGGGGCGGGGCGGCGGGGGD